MTTKPNIIVITICVIIAAAIPFLYRSHPGNKINYKTFRADSGWGYDVVVNGKLLIHQQYIPVVAQKKEFPTEQQAEEAAQLVVSKLKNNKLPTLSKAEVQQICGVN
jgi:hypothetical protein